MKATIFSDGKQLAVHDMVAIPQLQAFDAFMKAHGDTLPEGLTIELAIQADNWLASHWFRENLIRDQKLTPKTCCRISTSWRPMSA